MQIRYVRSYPELRKFKHLVGNYGGAWQNQKTEFKNFPGMSRVMHAMSNICSNYSNKGMDDVERTLRSIRNSCSNYSNEGMDDVEQKLCAAIC